MNKLGRFLLFIALVLILVGGGLFVYGYVKGDFEIVQATYLENTYEVEDSFSNIDIDVNISDVKFVYDSTLEKCKVLAKEYAENVMLCVDHRSDVYEAFTDGYEQAEKDLELTWRDIEQILDIINNLVDENFNADDFGIPANKEFYQEVLKRFKNFKERK